MPKTNVGYKFKNSTPKYATSLLLRSCPSYI